jgi:hypothetical protein
MKSRSAIVGIVGALVLAGSALAASPVKNGLYSGTLTGRGLDKRVQLHVSKSGKTATAALYCANTLAGSFATFKIKNGRFNAVKRTGSVKVMTLKGRFVTSKSVAVGLIPSAICDGVGGSFKLTLSSSP